MKLQQALNILDMSLLIKQDSPWWSTLRQFHNHIDIITKTCSIKKVKTDTTWEEWILLQYFNTQHLKGKSEAYNVIVLHYEAKKLLYFNYRNFIPEFILWLRNEFPNIVAESNQDHDFDKLVTSNQFQTRIQKIIKRKKLDPNVCLVR